MGPRCALKKLNHEATKGVPASREVTSGSCRPGAPRPVAHSSKQSQFRSLGARPSNPRNRFVSSWLRGSISSNATRKKCAKTNPIQSQTPTSAVDGGLDRGLPQLTPVDAGLPISRKRENKPTDEKPASNRGWRGVGEVSKWCGKEVRLGYFRGAQRCAATCGVTRGRAR